MMRRKGQSTLEYILLIAGVTLVALYGVKLIISKGSTQMTTAESVLEKADTNFKAGLGIVVATPVTPVTPVILTPGT